MTPFLLLAALVAIVGWILREPLWRRWHRSRVRAQPFPAAWREILRRRVPYVRTMPADLQLRLKKRMQVFLAEKPFIGCQGLDVTEEMRVTIAAQACLLLLNRRHDPFDELRQILVYPGAFIVQRDRVDALGLASHDRQVLAGESWSLGQVVLSWDDVVQGAADPADGRNVVIHEFAHQLDQASGATNGAPWLPGRRNRARWAEVMNQGYAELQQRLHHNEPGLIDPYAATSPAEYFAVLSETFFEQPVELSQQHPSLYAELRRLYAVDPLSW